jgi:glycosyltransferase involved in cell wall biosynthesis
VDAVRDGVTGLLVDPEDSAAATLALERLLTDPELSEAFAQAGVERARELEWSKVVERYRQLMLEVVAAPARNQSSENLQWLRDLATGPRLGAYKP